MSKLKDYISVDELYAKLDTYASKHDLAVECGAEYIYQSDSAQEDALSLVADIFDTISTNKCNEEE